MQFHKIVMVCACLGTISACDALPDHLDPPDVTSSEAAPRELAQRAYVKASNTGVNDQLGVGVAISADGATLAAGAFGEASAATGIDGDQLDDSSPNAGAVYVYRRRGQSWVQQAYVKASNTDAYDGFGWSVALSADGSTLAVGARFEASAATGVGGAQTDDSAWGAGAVYVFTRHGVLPRLERD